MLCAVSRSGVIALVAGAVLIVAGLATPAIAQQPIKIGIVGPMAFVQGENHWNGATLAMEEINKPGGVNMGGTLRPIELVKVDSNEILSVPDAATAMERAITRDKVDFVIGGFRSEAVLAMQEVAMDYKKIFLGAGAAHNKLGQRVTENYDRYKYWFRVTPLKQPANKSARASLSVLDDDSTSREGVRRRLTRARARRG